MHPKVSNKLHTLVWSNTQKLFDFILGVRFIKPFSLLFKIKKEVEMKCNCSVGNIVLGIIILVLALWPSLLGDMISKWIVVIASILLIIHELWHKHSWMLMNKGMKSDMPASRKKRR